MQTADLIAGLVLEDGSRWGEVAADWQWDDVQAILDRTGPRRHFLTRPRGGSKTSDLGAVIIAVLIDQAPAASRSYGFAVDRDQAGLLADAIAGFMVRTPEIRGALQLNSWKLTDPKKGATFEIMASDDASAYGLRPWFLICDEFAQWKTTEGPKRLWRAVYSSLPKVADSRLVIITSAGDPAHWSYRILETAEESDRWHVNQVAGPVPWISQDDLDEQKTVLPVWEFARLHLNQWTASDDRLTTVDDIRACVTLDGPQLPHPGSKYVVGLDIGLKNDRTVATVCHLEDKTVVLDRQETWRGTRDNPVRLEDVEAWIYETVRAYSRATVVCDPWQAAHLTQNLRNRRVRIQEFPFSTQSVGRLAITLHRLLRDHQVAIPDDPDLIDELVNVKLIETAPSSYRIDHDSSAHDDRVISLALAAHRLVTTSARPNIDRKKLAAALAQTSAELWKPSGGLVGY